jgi:hypothetical protein
MHDSQWEQYVRTLDPFWRYAFVDSALFISANTAFLAVADIGLFGDFYLSRKGLSLVRSYEPRVTSVVYVESYFAHLLRSDVLTLDKISELN